MGQAIIASSCATFVVRSTVVDWTIIIESLKKSHGGVVMGGDSSKVNIPPVAFLNDQLSHTPSPLGH
jgi:uncharacterized Zn-binding protein involved in type VI secretion